MTNLWTVVKNDYLLGLIIALAITGATYAIAVPLGWQDGANLDYIAVGASVLNYIATFLTIKQRRFYAIVGIVGSALWAWDFLQANLLASAVTNAYLAIWLIYSWWRWGKDTNTRKVHHLSLKWAPVYLVLTVATYFGAVWINNALGGSFAFWDSAILVLTILAQLLQDQKVILCWVVWMGANIIGVWEYFANGLYFAAVQQVLFGLSNIWGWVEWQKTMKADKLVEIAPVDFELPVTHL